jgi:hypothetical protein
MTQVRNIGITFRDGLPIKQSLSVNGITQNVIFLYLQLEKLGHNVFFVKEKKEPYHQFEILGKFYTAYTYQEVAEGKTPLDMLLEAAVVTSQKARNFYRQKLGARIVTVQYGHAMIHDMERLFYASEMKDSVRLSKPDITWASPHFEHSFGYLEMLYSSPIRTCPFIWEPMFMGKPYNQKDYVKTPNLQVMEANISLMKNALIPISIAENICRKDPSRFNQMYINGSQKLGQNPYFKANILPNMTWLSGHHKKILFGPRRPFNDTFKQRDILLSHQWGCDLNYLYLEALYMNIPLVHNSPRFKEVGYYYPEFDVNEGARAVKRAAKDTQVTEYHRAAKRKLKEFSIDNEKNLAGYQALIEETLALPPAAV